jgi:hypothetical protein
MTEAGPGNKWELLAEIDFFLAKIVMALLAGSLERPQLKLGSHVG